jgi:hypothetical protein
MAAQNRTKVLDFTLAARCAFWRDRIESVLQSAKHLKDSGLVHGMHDVPGDLGKGLQDETPLVQARVGHVQVGDVDDRVAVQQQVQVDRARVPLLAALPAQGALDLKEPLEQILRG